MYEHLRQHHRVSLTTELWIGQDGIFTRTDELLRNLSVGGAFVQTGQVFAIGSILSFRFKVPNAVNFVSCTALVRNMVVGDGLGVQFLDLSSENVRHIEQYVKTALERETPH
jgi:Tfp pilus assembly protein PilZ